MYACHIIWTRAAAAIDSVLRLGLIYAGLCIEAVFQGFETGNRRFLYGLSGRVISACFQTMQRDEDAASCAGPGAALPKSVNYQLPTFFFCRFVTLILWFRNWKIALSNPLWTILPLKAGIRFMALTSSEKPTRPGFYAVLSILCVFFFCYCWLLPGLSIIIRLTIITTRCWMPRLWVLILPIILIPWLPSTVLGAHPQHLPSCPVK